MADADPRTITRVRIRNYKSIAACDVRLEALTLLVGPNGAGKSNFLDALRFTSQALRFSLDHALRERGGIGDVRRRSRGHPNHFGIRLDLRLPASEAAYAFEVGARPNGGYEVRREECRVRFGRPGADRTLRDRERGHIAGVLPRPPAAHPDRPAVSAAGFQPCGVPTHL